MHDSILTSLILALEEESDSNSPLKFNLFKPVLFSNFAHYFEVDKYVKKEQSSEERP